MICCVVKKIKIKARVRVENTTIIHINMSAVDHLILKSKKSTLLYIKVASFNFSLFFVAHQKKKKKITKFDSNT